MFLSCRDAAQLMDSVSLWLNFVLDAVKRNLLCGFCAHASSWQNVPFRGKRCLIDSINRKRLTAPHLILSKKYHTLHHLTEFNLKLSLMLYWKAGKTHLKVQSATSELQPLFPAWNVDTACRAMWRSWGLTVQVSATAKTPVRENSQVWRWMMKLAAEATQVKTRMRRAMMQLHSIQQTLSAAIKENYKAVRNPSASLPLYPALCVCVCVPGSAHITVMSALRLSFLSQFDKRNKIKVRIVPFFCSRSCHFVFTHTELYLYLLWRQSIITFGGRCCKIKGCVCVCVCW